MAHSDVALDVESWRTREPEGLHVSKDLSLEETALRPGTTESADEFIIDWTTVLIYQLDPLVTSIMSVAVVYDNIKAIYYWRTKIVELIIRIFLKQIKIG